jgi:multifunctional beta-oxidation protein
MLLHGEQYLAIHQENIPTSGTLVNKAQIAEVLDKGKGGHLLLRHLERDHLLMFSCTVTDKAAAVVIVVKTFNKDDGELVFENHVTVFCRGSGGFGGKKTSSGLV